MSTYVIEAAWRQAFREMRSKQEGCEEGQADVVVVEEVGVVVCTAFPSTQKHLQREII